MRRASISSMSGASRLASASMRSTSASLKPPGVRVAAVNTLTDPEAKTMGYAA